MKGICGIDIDRDNVFISFAAVNRGRINFLKEIEVGAICDDGFLDYFKKNSERLNKSIMVEEKRLSIKVDDVFLNLPRQLEKKRVVEDVVPFKKRKKINPPDLIMAKKHIADIFLDWDDFCIHNFVLGCEIEGKLYPTLPIGVPAKKIKLKSLLVWVKDKLHREVEDIFDNVDRRFGGFVSSDASSFTASFPEGYIRKNDKDIFCVINIGYDNSHFVVCRAGALEFGKEFDFGSKKIIAAIEKRFLLSPVLANEVFARYISFKNVPYYKEISIKKSNTYTNLSTQAVNSFVREYIKGEVNFMLEKIKQKVGIESFILSFVGRLNAKEGFYSFLKDFIPYQVKVFSPTGHNKSVSSSFGCLKYGMHRFLELEYCRKQESFWERFLKVYKEYF
ncbi:MAG: hypothetical protein ABIH71_03425 [Candidatus Omnitrophota bacterium]|nr:hypothetical protein [Candidatus Omnitrophota bacterium]